MYVSKSVVEVVPNHTKKERNVILRILNLTTPHQLLQTSPESISYATTTTTLLKYTQATMATIPDSLKTADIARFVTRATQVERAKPVVAYWCW